MQKAKRNEDSGMLETYLESLVPDFRRKISHVYLAGAMFPNLGGRVEFKNGRPRCYCVVHETIAPDGLDWRAQFRIQGLRRGTKTEVDGENVTPETDDETT